MAALGFSLPKEFVTNKGDDRDRRSTHTTAPEGRVFARSEDATRLCWPAVNGTACDPLLHDALGLGLLREERYIRFQECHFASLESPTDIAFPLNSVRHGELALETNTDILFSLGTDCPRRSRVIIQMTAWTLALPSEPVQRQPSSLKTSLALHEILYRRRQVSIHGVLGDETCRPSSQCESKALRSFLLAYD